MSKRHTNGRSKPAVMARHVIALASLCVGLGLVALLTCPRWFPSLGPRNKMPGISTTGSAAHVPVSLAEMLQQVAQRQGRFDIGLMNLVCAQGLPGYGGGDARQWLATLDAWSEQVRRETDRALPEFRRHPEAYHHSEAYFRALCLVTVLQQDLGVRYNPARITPPDAPEPDEVFFADSQDLFLHGMLGPRRSGTCISLPVLHVAVGRRLGYPLKLVLAKGHVFARWESSDGTDRFNLEVTNQGLNCFPDEYYESWPYPMTAEEVRSGRYLKSLTPAEELALFLQTRGHCLRSAGRFTEAREAYFQSQGLAPHWPENEFLIARVTPAPAITAPLSRPPLNTLATEAEAMNRYHRQSLPPGGGSGPSAWPALPSLRTKP